MNTLSTAHYEIKTGCHLWPTPAGAFYAVQSVTADPARRFLLQLLSQTDTTPFTEGQLTQIDDDADNALRIIYHLQNLGYLQAIPEPFHNARGQLEELLPPLLARIVDSGKAVLADEQGFYLSLSGFPHESAEELSALSANLYTVQERHSKLLQNNLGIKSSAWGMVDAAGNSEIGFWPLFFPRNRFSLILAGMPHFNCVEFTTLIAALAMRYHH